jgi:hypothetical protein
MGNAYASKLFMPEHGWITISGISRDLLKISEKPNSIVSPFSRRIDLSADLFPWPFEGNESLGITPQPKNILTGKI